MPTEGLRADDMSGSLPMDTREMLTDVPRCLPLGRADGMSSYLAECEALWRRQVVPENAVLMLVQESDYAGNLLLSLLRSQQQLTPVLLDAKFTLAHAPRSAVEERIQFVYASLSLEFTPPEIQRLRTVKNALLVFADTEVSAIDGTQIFQVLS